MPPRRKRTAVAKARRGRPKTVTTVLSVDVSNPPANTQSDELFVPRLSRRQPVPSQTVRDTGSQQPGVRLWNTQTLNDGTPSSLVPTGSVSESSLNVADSGQPAKRPRRSQQTSHTVTSSQAPVQDVDPQYAGQDDSTSTGADSVGQ